MEYTREQAVRMFKEFQYFKLKSCGVKIVPELNKWEEDFLNVKFPQEETYFIGDRFEIDGNEYILSRINNKLCLLINLSTGNYYENPIPVEDINKITKVELGRMIGGDEFFINKVTKIK
jgi:hypothetical protein